MVFTFYYIRGVYKIVCIINTNSSTKTTALRTHLVRGLIEAV
jgi:hypothetical protein